jgi:hypothetical protein
MLRDQLELPVIEPIALPGRFADCQFGDFDDTPSKIVGDYFLKKYRDRAAQVGVQTVARQLRKQGCPVEIAAVILAVRS